MWMSKLKNLMMFNRDRKVKYRENNKLFAYSVTTTVFLESFAK